MPEAIPVLKKERITIIDSLRGIAILGILLMNIPYFGLPDPAQFYDLAVLNEEGTINEKVWLVITWIFNGTQRALFALLFGAGVVLFTQRQEQKTGNLAADYFVRRQLWLMAFGLVNFYILLWIGDYLFPYACCAIILYVFRNRSPQFLLAAALVCLAIMVVKENREMFRNKNIISTGEKIEMIDTTTTKLTARQKQDLQAMLTLKKNSQLPSRQAVAKSSIEKMNSGYSTLYQYQRERGLVFFMYLAYFEIWSLLIFMFIGMAFYKSGILMGKASINLYWIMTIAGLVGGLALSWYRIDVLMDNNFSRYEYNKQMVFNLSEPGRILRSLGLFGLVMLMYRSGWFGWFFGLMRPVGQMAFTNYLAQSLFMGIYFYGSGYYGMGMGMFGQLERYQLYYVVGITWVIQIIYSHAWMHYFQFGPLEWIWRQLTYWKKLPLRVDH